MTPASFPPESAIADRDALYLRAAITLSQTARDRGNRPFGAVIVSPKGEVLTEAWNSNGETGDCTAHAETKAVRAEQRDAELSCREVFNASPHKIECIGPALIEESSVPHAGFWKT